jgi:hypothetical protein
MAEPAQTGVAFVARGFTGFAFGSIHTPQPAAAELQAKRNAGAWKNSSCKFFRDRLRICSQS